MTSIDDNASRELSSEEGVVASMHVHPPVPGSPLLSLEMLELVEGKGIRQDTRYFNRKSRSSGQPSKRQVTIIAREQIQEHSAELGIPPLDAGVVRSNIEITGVHLERWLGCEVEMGQARVLIHELRTPCPKMDAIHPGLQQNMKNGRQGVLAQVVKSGVVRVGDPIRRLGRSN
jgi:MOSC domain-containing protein YiiM